MSGAMSRRSGDGLAYITMVSELDCGTVDYVADERCQVSPDGYFDKFTTEHLASVHAVAMDMSSTFAASVHHHLTEPDDKILFDRYHMLGYLATAVYTVRQVVNKAPEPDSRPQDDGAEDSSHETKPV